MCIFAFSSSDSDFLVQSRLLEQRWTQTDVRKQLPKSPESRWWAWVRCRVGSECGVIRTGEEIKQG